MTYNTQEIKSITIYPIKQYKIITDITVQYQFDENLLVSLISINSYTQKFRKLKSKERIFTTTTTRGSDI